MNITTDAPLDEHSSPFFIVNKKFCVVFENYVTHKKGTAKGKYTAWAYTIFGELPTPINWTLLYKKATLSSGHLLLPSKYQNLFTWVEWTKKGTDDKTKTPFLIRKRKRIDFFSLQLNPNLSKLEVTTKYILKSKEAPSPMLLKMLEILEPLFLSGEINQVKQSKGVLQIILRIDKHHFEILDKLLEIE